MPETDECFILNLDDNNGKGTHWCCIISGLYFDSFGLSPPNEVINRVKRYNNIQYQEKTSVLCGYFCLFFIKKIQEGFSYYDILYKELTPFNPIENEKVIINYFI